MKDFVLRAVTQLKEMTRLKVYSNPLYGNIRISTEGNHLVAQLGGYFDSFVKCISFAMNQAMEFAFECPVQDGNDNS